MIKMYCIFSQEGIEKMQGNRGKMAAQAGHAYLHAWWNAQEKWNEFTISDNIEFIDSRIHIMNEYRYGMDARKICLIVETDEDLIKLVNNYDSIAGTTLVEDCGYTIVEPGTITAAGIGPLRDEDKGDDLKALPLFI